MSTDPRLDCSDFYSTGQLIGPYRYSSSYYVLDTLNHPYQDRASIRSDLESILYQVNQFETIFGQIYATRNSVPVPALTTWRPLEGCLYGSWTDNEPIILHLNVVCGGLGNGGGDHSKHTLMDRIDELRAFGGFTAFNWDDVPGYSCNIFGPKLVLAMKEAMGRSVGVGQDSVQGLYIGTIGAVITKKKKKWTSSESTGLITLEDLEMGCYQEMENPPGFWYSQGWVTLREGTTYPIQENYCASRLSGVDIGDCTTISCSDDVCPTTVTYEEYLRPESDPTEQDYLDITLASQAHIFFRDEALFNTGVNCQYDCLVEGCCTPNYNHEGEYDGHSQADVIVENPHWIESKLDAFECRYLTSIEGLPPQLYEDLGIKDARVISKPPVWIPPQVTVSSGVIVDEGFSAIAYGGHFYTETDEYGNCSVYQGDYELDEAIGFYPNDTTQTFPFTVCASDSIPCTDEALVGCPAGDPGCCVSAVTDPDDPETFTGLVLYEDYIWLSPYLTLDVMVSLAGACGNVESDTVLCNTAYDAFENFGNDLDDYKTGMYKGYSHGIQNYADASFQGNLRIPTRFWIAFSGFQCPPGGYGYREFADLHAPAESDCAIELYL